MLKVKIALWIGLFLFALANCQQPTSSKTADEVKLKAAAERIVGFQGGEFKIEFSKFGKIERADVTVVPKPPSNETKNKVLFQKDGDEWRVMEILKIADKVMEIDLYKKDNQYEIRGHEIRNGGDWHYMRDCKNEKGSFPYGVIADEKLEPLGYFQMPHGLRIILCWDGIDPVTKEMTGGMEELSEGEIKLQLPYIPEGKYTIIYDESEKKLLTIDIQKYCIVK